MCSPTLTPPRCSSNWATRWAALAASDAVGVRLALAVPDADTVPVELAVDEPVALDAGVAEVVAVSDGDELTVSLIDTVAEAEFDGDAI